MLVEQDGIFGALHTVSKDGALIHLDRGADATAQGLPVWGYDFPPGRVAIQSLQQPWAPSWMAGLIDDKPVPFEETAAETTRGNFKPPLWRRSYLGRWHGLASADIRGGTVDVMAQWVRAPQKAVRMEDLGTLTLRYAANEPNLANTHEGASAQAGLPLTFQSRNRAIVFAKPHGNRERFLDAFDKGAKDTISQLATVIGLWNFAEKKDWEIFVGEQKVTSFPHRSTASQRILIRDGVSYLAILPIAPTDLGRDAEIEIGPGGSGKAPPSNAVIAPALTISMFNLRRPHARADRLARLADARPAHLRRLRAGAGRRRAARQLRRLRPPHQGEHARRRPGSADRNLLEVSYRSGSDLMEAVLLHRLRPAVGDAFRDRSRPAGEGDPGAPAERPVAVPAARPRARHDMGAAGHDRPAGEERRGADDRARPQGVSHLPIRRAAAWSPTIRCPIRRPGRSRRRTAPASRPTARSGLLRLEYRPWSREVEISHALKPDQKGDDLAKRLTISGLAQAPRVTVNGRRADVSGAAPDFQVALTP